MRYFILFYNEPTVMSNLTGTSLILFWVFFSFFMLFLEGVSGFVCLLIKMLKMNIKYFNLG